jgi:hypothetical protein
VVQFVINSTLGKTELLSAQADVDVGVSIEAVGLFAFYFSNYSFMLARSKYRYYSLRR